MDTSPSLSCEPKSSLVFPDERTRSEESARQKAWALPPLTGEGGSPRAIREQGSALMSASALVTFALRVSPLQSRVRPVGIACSTPLAHARSAYRHEAPIPPKLLDAPIGF